MPDPPVLQGAPLALLWLDAVCLFALFADAVFVELPAVFFLLLLDAAAAVFFCLAVVLCSNNDGGFDFGDGEVRGECEVFVGDVGLSGAPGAPLAIRWLDAVCLLAFVADAVFVELPAVFVLLLLDAAAAVFFCLAASLCSDKDGGFEFGDGKVRGGGSPSSSSSFSTSSGSPGAPGVVLCLDGRAASLVDLPLAFFLLLLDATAVFFFTVAGVICFDDDGDFDGEEHDGEDEADVFGSLGSFLLR